MDDFQRDHTNRMERDYVGLVVRLEIPLKSVMNLRRVAELLHGLAHQLECMGRFRNEKPSVTMLEVRSLVRKTNNDLRKIRGRGRPSNGPDPLNML